MREENFILEIYSELISRNVAPILMKGRVDKLARTYQVSNPWEVLEVYVRYANNPVIRIARDRVFVFLNNEAKNEKFYTVEKNICNDIRKLKKKGIIY